VENDVDTQIREIVSNTFRKAILISLGVVWLIASAYAQGLSSSDATSLQGKRIKAPLTCGADGYVITWVAANSRFECLAQTGGGSGTVTNSGSLTSGAVIKGNGGADVTASGASIDASNNLSTPGGINAGVGSGVTGALDLTDSVSGFKATITPATLGGNRTITQQDVAGDMAVLSGSFAVDDCAKYSSAGKLVSAGPCAGGGGSSGLVLVEQHTASSSASLDFTSCFSSTYDDYRIELVNLVLATNNVDLDFRVSTDGGSTFSTTGYEYIFENNSTSNAGWTATASTSTSSILLAPGIDNTQSYGVSGEISFRGPLSASLKKSLDFRLTFVLQAVARRYMQIGAGFWGTTTAVNAFRLLASSGNITSGTVRCYGIAK
jgi:hypothetical protein